MARTTHQHHQQAQLGHETLIAAPYLRGHTDQGQRRQRQQRQAEPERAWRDQQIGMLGDQPEALACRREPLHRAGVGAMK
uniref:hypothetical protein n=1 Tax=Pseudomonas fluorescens TaxID=294 RepID=UPI001C5891EB|nr:hypothetical protein [Pseudomonas fluorescens]